MLTPCESEPALTVTVAGEVTDPVARVTVNVKGLLEPVIIAVNPDGAAATGAVVDVTCATPLDPRPVHAVNVSCGGATVGQSAGAGENEQFCPTGPATRRGWDWTRSLAKLALMKCPLASVIVSVSSTHALALTVKPPPEN